jgi:phosphoglycolate phosphatase
LYKHIIFDFDGTLVDSIAAMIETFNDSADKFGFNRLNQNDYKLFNNSSLKQKFKILGVPYYRMFFLGQIGNELKYKYKKHLCSIDFFDGMMELLLKLKALGVTISIITSNSADNIAEFMNVKGVNIIDDIQSSNGFYGKSRTLKKYLHKHQLQNHEIVYVGDELRDIKACKKSNIDIISVTWGLDSQELLKSANPKYIITKPTQILDLFQQSV